MKGACLARSIDHNSQSSHKSTSRHKLSNLYYILTLISHNFIVKHVKVQCICFFIFHNLIMETGSLLRSRSGQSHATLPVPKRPLGDGERCVTPARAAAKETNVTSISKILGVGIPNNNSIHHITRHGRDNLLLGIA